MFSVHFLPAARRNLCSQTQNLGNCRGSADQVKFDINSNKWSCDCPHFLLSQQALDLCCKHIQGTIDLKNNYDRFNDPRYLDLLRRHITQE